MSDAMRLSYMGVGLVVLAIALPEMATPRWLDVLAAFAAGILFAVGAMMVKP